jgi:hypothetical protein
MELNPPNFTSRVCGRFDPFDGRIVAVDEEGFPSSWERIFQLECILVVLAVDKKASARWRELRRMHKPGNIHSAGLDRAGRRKGEYRLVMAPISKRHSIGLKTCSHADNLVSHAYTKHGLFPFLKRLAKFESDFHAMFRVPWAIAQEQTIELIPNGIEIVVPG